MLFQIYKLIMLMRKNNNLELKCGKKKLKITKRKLGTIIHRSKAPSRLPRALLAVRSDLVAVQMASAYHSPFPERCQLRVSNPRQCLIQHFASHRVVYLLFQLMPAHHTSQFQPISNSLSPPVSWAPRAAFASAAVVRKEKKKIKIKKGKVGN